MAVKKKTISIPRELFDLAVARALRLGYDSFSEYVQYLVREDVKNKPPHSTLRIDPHAPPMLRVADQAPTAETGDAK